MPRPQHVQGVFAALLLLAANANGQSLVDGAQQSQSVLDENDELVASV